MISAASMFENIELTVYVGNLDAGAEIAQLYMNQNFDVIISRGGTAELIKTFSPVPVLDIPLSVYDILRTIKLTTDSPQGCSVIGFPSITTQATLLCDLLHYNMEIITIHHKSEVVPALLRLKEKGCQYVLCDVIAETMARQMGIHPILMISGTESIQNTFEQALRICSYSDSLIQKNMLLEAAMIEQPANNTIILKEDGSIFFSNYNEENIYSVTEYLKDLIQQPLKNHTTKAFHLIDNSLYSLTCKPITTEYARYYLFFVEPNPVPAGSSKYGLRFSTQNDMATMYTNSFFVLSASALFVEDRIKQLNQSRMPIMILGELGTGKNQVAARLYIESALRDNPYITIDCPLINERNWNFLIKHYNSPLFDKNNTIFISNIQALSDIQQQQLLSLLVDTNAHKRNRIIFSCSQTLKPDTEDPSKHFINTLTCSTIVLPTLRDLIEDLPSSATLYLNTLNVEMSKQIIGFAPEAMALLKSYSWPGNLLQLKRVLTDLVLYTSTQHIEADTVQKVLEQEKRQHITVAPSNFDYNRPLNTMIQDIVQIVLDQCGGNQTKAAKQLGIGRTTLWRYLNPER